MEPKHDFSQRASTHMREVEGRSPAHGLDGGPAQHSPRPVMSCGPTLRPRPCGRSLNASPG